MGWNIEYMDEFGTGGMRSTSLWLKSCMTCIWKHCVKRAVPMAKQFAELQARMTPQARAEAQQLVQQHLQEMPLHELRKAQQLSQQSLA